MRFTILLLGASMLFLTTGCAEIKNPGTFYDAMPKQQQYPIATTSYDATDAYAGQGVSYNRGSVTVFPMDQSAPIAQPYQHHSNSSYTYGSDMAPITSYGQTMSMIMNDENAIYFKHGSSRLGNIDKDRIQKLAAQLKETGQSAHVVGYASQPVYTTKNPEQQNIINLHMSAKRAMAVTEELYRAGVEPKQVETISQGDAYSDGNNKEDRRVDMILN